MGRARPSRRIRLRARARAPHPDGKLVLFVGIQNHGQGLETTLAQVAYQELGIAVEDVIVRHGDSAVSPYGMGTFASRSMTMAGGAYRAPAPSWRKNQTHRRASAAGAKGFRDARRRSGAFRRAKRLVLRHRPGRLPASGALPEGEEPALETSAVYQPGRSTGAFSYATHACVVAVDPGTGIVELLDYVACHDCGTMVNPLLVEAQVVGGIAQGIGTALYEESPYDNNGQPLATTFLDYMIRAPRRCRMSACCTWKRRRLTPGSASRAWAKAARSRHRRRW